MNVKLSSIKTEGKDQEADLIKRKLSYSYRLRRSVARRPLLYLMLIPGMVWFVIFCYWPMYGIVMGFQDYDWGKGFFGSPFVGLKHFIRFFNGVYAWRIIRNTLVISVWTVVFGFPAPIILALLINEMRNNTYKRVVQTISYLPYFVSTVVVVGIIFNLVSFSGPINAFLVRMGQQPIYFMAESGWFRPIYVLSGIWQSVGWGSIIYIAAMAGINPELYEAAIVDGAKKLQQVRYITLPSIMPTIAILLILQIASFMSVGFEKIYLLYNPIILEKADVIATYVYREGLVSMNYSYAAAIGFFQSVVNLILLLTANKITKVFTEHSFF
ncbi:MAG: sugar ABC transporter permease [Spirochaetales bacterium]|nr:sugar ABC transporter permease [Spirochaetales bacterium]